MYPTDFGNSSYMRTIPAADAGPAVDAVESLLGGIGFRGVYSAEFKLDPRDGTFRLLEVNARPWWYVEFAARCGVDVVRMAYQDALGYDVPPALEYAVGRRLAYPRYDFYALLDAMKARRAGPLELLRSWTGSDRPIFSWDDPMPALREAAHNLSASLVRRLPGRRPSN
jgi:predicted ATP-grasp superfamily ATP-dependent carboligase